MADTVTHARILDTRTAGEVVLWEIAVALPGGGEYRPGWIEGGSYVMAGGLIVGLLVAGERGREFKPMGSGGGGSSFGQFHARILSANPVSFGRWEYDWEQVTPSATQPGEFDLKEGGKNSAMDGRARNGVETPNLPASVLGSGVDAATLPSGFQPVPVGDGAVVRLSGPYGSGSGAWWLFTVSTHVDGSC